LFAPVLSYVILGDKTEACNSMWNFSFVSCDSNRYYTKLENR